jgi:hypothetical protein
MKAIQGMETVDVNENSSFKDYLKSKLILIPTILLIQYSLYIGTLVVILVIFNSKTQLELVMYWSVTSVIISIPFTIYFYYLSRRRFKFKINYLAIIKYVIISTGIFGLTYFLMEEYLIFYESIFEFLPHLLLFVALGVGGYLFISYFTDRNTKNLVKSIFSEIKNKK